MLCTHNRHHDTNNKKTRVFVIWVFPMFDASIFPEGPTPVINDPDPANTKHKFTYRVIKQSDLSQLPFLKATPAFRQLCDFVTREEKGQSNKFNEFPTCQRVVIAADRKDRVAGLLGFGIDIEEDGWTEGHLYHLWVNPVYRLRGLGGKLQRMFLRYVGNTDRASLQSYHSAVSFWTKNGWDPKLQMFDGTLFMVRGVIKSRNSLPISTTI